MRNIIRVLLNEGIEREDVVAICKYIKEEYDVVEDAVSKYKGFNSEMTQDRSKEISNSIQKQIEADEAKIAKKPNKSAEKRIANNKEYLQAHQMFQASGKKTPFEGGKIGEV